MNNESVKEILDYLEQTSHLSEDNIYEAVRALGDLKDKRMIPFLLNMLMNEKHVNFVRDALAISLGKLGANEAVPFIMQLILDPLNINNRGSLIYALWNLECEDYFLEFIEIVCSGNFESRQMALKLVEKYSEDINSQIRKEAINTLKKYKILIEVSNKNKEESLILRTIDHVEDVLIRQ